MSKLEKNSNTARSFFWSFIENFMSQAVTFIVGIVLSRLLSPDLFGLVGMVTIFIAVSEIFVNSGFHQSLIRKEAVTQDDFSTIFYSNIAISLFFWVVLFAISGWVSEFYSQPVLKQVLPIFGVVVIIDSLSLVQKTDLTRRLDFKSLAKISVFSNTIGGIVAIYAAMNGMGVWSLVIKSITQKAISTLLLWVINKWRPTWVFKWSLLLEHFGFGSRLLISGIVDTIFSNLYYLVIGKFFSPTQVGYYSRADQFQKLPSSNLSGIISRVSFPLLSRLYGNIPELLKSFQRILITTMFIVGPIMAFLAVIADVFIIALVGEDWLPSAVYLQLLSIIGIFYPIHHLNLLIPQIMNRTDVFLRLELLKKFLVLLIVAMGIKWGIVWMLWATLVFNLIAFFMHAWWTSKFLGYTIVRQMGDLLPPLVLTILTSFVVFSCKWVFTFESPQLTLVIQSGFALVVYLILVRLFFKHFHFQICSWIVQSGVVKSEFLLRLFKSRDRRIQ